MKKEKIVIGTIAIINIVLLLILPHFVAVKYSFYKNIIVFSSIAIIVTLFVKKSFDKKNCTNCGVELKRETERAGLSFKEFYYCKNCKKKFPIDNSAWESGA